ncbi:MAG: O-antigen ligase family protein [Candidatus Pelagibacter sp.]
MYSYYKENKFLILLGIFWIILWSSLNTFPPDMDYFKNINLKHPYSKEFFIQTINLIRFYSPVIFTNIFLIILILKSQKYVHNFSFLLIIYFIFFLSQLIGLILFDSHNFNLERTFLVILAFNGIGIIYLANKILNDNQIKIFYFINLFFLFFIVIVYLPIMYIDFFNSVKLYLYNSQTWKETFLDDPIIRVTGLSRVLALVSIILLVKLNEKLSKKTFLIIFLLLIFIGINIWGFQSRITIFSLIIIIFLNLIFFSKNQILKNVIAALLIISFSIIGFKAVQNLKLVYLKSEKSELLFEDQNFVDVYKNFLEEKPNRIAEVYSRSKDLKVDDSELKYITSSRNVIWSKIINSYDYKKLFGYGPQADRYVLLKETENPSSGYMTNTSSSLFYAFICGGYIGLILFIIINIYVLLILFQFLKMKTYLKKDNFYLNSLFLIIIFIGIRSFFENSHAVFSLDFLVFLSSTMIFNKLLKKI